jgi:Ca2+-binding EF-hand superfamily protein
LAEAARLVAAASPEVDPVTQNREALMCYFETELDALTKSIEASKENFDAKINSVNQKIAHLCLATEKTNTLLESQANVNANLCLATEKTNTLLESQAKIKMLELSVNNPSLYNSKLRNLTWSFFEKRKLVNALYAGTMMAPYQESSIRDEDGVSSVSFQSITAMAQYEHKSFEELRLEDYMAGNKGTQGPTQPPATGAFGAAPAGGGGAFGAPAAATGAFGFPKPAPGGFGGFGASPVPAAGGGLVGNSTPAPVTRTISSSATNSDASFPPMSAKAPTPFGREQDVATLTSNSFTSQPKRKPFVKLARPASSSEEGPKAKNANPFTGGKFASACTSPSQNLTSTIQGGRGGRGDGSGRGRGGGRFSRFRVRGSRGRGRGSSSPIPLVASTTPTSKPFGGASFGSTSTIGSSPSPFGSSTKCASSLSAPYGSISFGITSATAGSFSLAPTVATTEPMPTLSENDRNAQVFGSGSKAPEFGSGSAPTFGSGTSNIFGTLVKGSIGLGSLAGQAEDKKESASPFGTFYNSLKPSLNVSTVKPLFQQCNFTTINSGPKPNKTFQASLPNNIERPGVSQQSKFEAELLLSVFLSSVEAKYAVKLFDTLDQDKEGQIPIDRLQILLQEISKGFHHGDELDKQSAILDPDSSGFISRSSFIDWYCKQLGDDSNDIRLLDTNEREGRKNETTKTVDASESIATAGVYKITDFGKLIEAARIKLIEAVGTTYCEEEYRREIRKISDDSGNISKEECGSWWKKKLAADAFESIATAGVVKNTDFGKLMEAARVKLTIKAVGSTYCEEECRRAMKKISDGSGNISKDAFISWYTDWFSDREKECNDTTVDEFIPVATSAYLNIDTATGIATSIPIYRNRTGTGFRPVATSAYPNRVILRGRRPVATSVNPTTDTAASIPAWGSTFAIDKNSWKCEACMVRNNGDVAKCAACEIVRPGHENNAQTGGESKSSAQIGGGASSGFTFSGAAGAGEDGTSSSKGAGFSFGFNASSNALKAPAASFDYSIGAPPTTGLSASPASGGFSFGYNTASYNTASPVKKAAPTPFGGSSTKPVGSSGSAFPASPASGGFSFGYNTASYNTASPVKKAAPTPFGGSSTKPVGSSGSAFPPIRDREREGHAQ